MKLLLRIPLALLPLTFASLASAAPVTWHITGTVRGFSAFIGDDPALPADLATFAAWGIAPGTPVLAALVFDAAAPPEDPGSAFHRDAVLDFQVLLGSFAYVNLDPTSSHVAYSDAGFFARGLQLASSETRIELELSFAEPPFPPGPPYPSELPIAPPPLDSLLPFPSCPYCNNAGRLGSELMLYGVFGTPLSPVRSRIHVELSELVLVPEPTTAALVAAGCAALAAARRRGRRAS